MERRQRRRADKGDDLERLARRAAAGDIDAASRLIDVIARKRGTPVTIFPHDVLGLFLEALSSARLLLEDFARDNEGGYLFWQPGGKGYETLNLAKLASVVIENPGYDWKHKAMRIRTFATRKTCRHCGETIYDMREESGAQDADWATEDGDFGCNDSPDTVYPGDDPGAPGDFGAGSHEPEED